MCVLNYTFNFDSCDLLTVNKVLPWNIVSTQYNLINPLYYVTFKVSSPAPPPPGRGRKSISQWTVQSVYIEPRGGWHTYHTG